MPGNRLVLIVGASGSGKTTLESRMCAGGNYRKMVTCTTRPKRDNEVDGIHYHFITEDQFITKDMVERVVYNGFHYGLSVKELEAVLKVDQVAVMEPNGVASVIEYLSSSPEMAEIRLYIIYFNIPMEVREKNMLARGDSPDLVKKRLNGETVDSAFAELGLRADITIDKLTDSIPEMVVEEISNF